MKIYLNSIVWHYDQQQKIEYRIFFAYFEVQKLSVTSELFFPLSEVTKKINFGTSELVIANYKYAS